MAGAWKSGGPRHERRLHRADDGLAGAAGHDDDDSEALRRQQLAGAGAKDVNRIDIKTVLVSNGAYAAMKAYIANPGAGNQQALIACNYLLAIVDYEPGTVGPVLVTSNPTNLATINALLPGLTADPNTGVTPATINALNALITPLVPWWQMHGFSMPVTVADLAAAGNLF